MATIVHIPEPSGPVGGAQSQMSGSHCSVTRRHVETKWFLPRQSGYKLCDECKEYKYIYICDGRNPIW